MSRTADLIPGLPTVPLLAALVAGCVNDGASPPRFVRPFHDDMISRDLDAPVRVLMPDCHGIAPTPVHPSYASLSGSRIWVAFGAEEGASFRRSCPPDGSAVPWGLEAESAAAAAAADLSDPLVGIFATWSDDGGATFHSPPLRLSRGRALPFSLGVSRGMAMGTAEGRVVVTFIESEPEPRIVVLVSEDDGRSFSLLAEQAAGDAVWWSDSDSVGFLDTCVDPDGYVLVHYHLDDWQLSGDSAQHLARIDPDGTWHELGFDSFLAERAWWTPLGIPAVRGLQCPGNGGLDVLMVLAAAADNETGEQRFSAWLRTSDDDRDRIVPYRIFPDSHTDPEPQSSFFGPSLESGHMRTLLQVDPHAFWVTGHSSAVVSAPWELYRLELSGRRTEPVSIATLSPGAASDAAESDLDWSNTEHDLQRLRFPFRTPLGAGALDSSGYWVGMAQQDGDPAEGNWEEEPQESLVLQIDEFETDGTRRRATLERRLDNLELLSDLPPQGPALGSGSLGQILRLANGSYVLVAWLREDWLGRFGAGTGFEEELVIVRLDE